MSVLEEVSINISCGNLSCTRALQSALGIWTHIPHLSRVTLLKPVYGYGLSVDEWRRFHGDTSKVKPGTFACFRNRQTMATWTPSRGWERDINLEEEVLEEEEKNAVRRMVR